MLEETTAKTSDNKTLVNNIACSKSFQWGHRARGSYLALSTQAVECVLWRYSQETV